MEAIVSALKARLDELLATREQVLVALDGNCAAGKTTLASRLQAACGGSVLHMDDFFLRPEQRTPERYAQPGGNVDYERFREEVLKPLQAGSPFFYRPFDCGSFTLGQPVSIEPGKLTIIEGTYSMHPYFGDVYDLKVFLSVNPELQEERIRKRPEFLHKRFFEAWIPMEQAYFDHFSIPEQADILLEAGHWGKA